MDDNAFITIYSGEQSLKLVDHLFDGAPATLVQGSPQPWSQVQVLHLSRAAAVPGGWGGQWLMVDQCYGQFIVDCWLVHG